MSWKRARTEKQKSVRIAEIVKATEKLYKKLDFEEITFAMIAKEAKFTRSNLYKYFNSKEEVFLEFLKHDIIKWRKEILKTFQKNRKYSVSKFASMWVELIVKRKRLLELFSILYIYIEKNISMERLIEFKTQAAYELNSISQLLCSLFPTLTPEKVPDFIHLQLASSIGLSQMSNLSKTQKKVFEYPEFSHMRVDFKKLYNQSVEFFLSGLVDSNS